MSECCVTTVIEFEDGSIEGQMLHEGDRESCEKLLPLLSAISVSDGRSVKAAHLRIVPRSAMDYPVGQCWRYADTQEETP